MLMMRGARVGGFVGWWDVEELPRLDGSGVKVKRAVEVVERNEMGYRPHP